MPIINAACSNILTLLKRDHSEWNWDSTIDILEHESGVKVFYEYDNKNTNCSGMGLFGEFTHDKKPLRIHVKTKSRIIVLKFNTLETWLLLRRVNKLISKILKVKAAKVREKNQTNSVEAAFQLQFWLDEHK